MVEARPTVTLTFKNYCKIPNKERWELLDGELIMAPPLTRSCCLGLTPT